MLIAGAGTGKTHTLCSRVSRLIQSGVEPSKILLLTFTRKAANEMIDRIGDILFDQSKNIQAGTFHAIAFNDLRASGRLNSLLGMLDDSAANSYIRKQLKIAKFSPLQNLGSRSVLQFFSLCNNTRKSTSQVAQEFFPEVATQIDLLNEMRQIYIQYKKDMQVMDYDDILLLWLETLSKKINTPSTNCEYILVDEYQDTSQLQIDILRALCRNHDNIMAVGDDCQSIYSFRGALPAQLKQFPLDFPGAQTITLEDNYRSTDNILQMSNQLMASSTAVLPKTLKSAVKAQGDEPRIIYTQSKFQAPDLIIDSIFKSKQKGTPLNQQAILYRSSVHALMIEAQLVRQGIPYIKYGSRKLTEAAHLKDFLALLIFVFHKTIHPLAVQRSLELLPGLGAKTVEKVLIHLHNDRHLLDFKFSAKAEDAVIALMNLRLDHKEINSKSIQAVLQFYTPFLNARFDDNLKRQRDINILTQNLLNAPSLDDFFTDIALSYGEQAEEPEGDALILSTIHSAKGKEWDSVYVIDVNEGSIPMSSSRDIEEERRLLYVAMTRARKNLQLIVNNNPSQPKASRFLNFKTSQTKSADDFPKKLKLDQFTRRPQDHRQNSSISEPDDTIEPEAENDDDFEENTYSPYYGGNSPTTSIATSDDDELTYVSMDDW